MSEPPPGSRIPLPGRIRALLASAAGLEQRFLLERMRPGIRGRLVRAVQSCVLAARRYREDHAGDRAGALAFATLLSVVPLLLLALAAFGAAGMSEESLRHVREWLFLKLVPDTAQGLQQTLETTLAALQGSRRGLGLAGLAALVLTGWKLLATLQRTFEQIWGVRDFTSKLKRMLGFWGAVMLAPFLVAASLLLSGGVEAAAGWIPAGSPASTLAYLLPTLPGWAGVLLVYRTGTGKRTRWRAAVLGATLAAVSWEFLKVGFAVYVKHTFLTRSVLSGMGVVPVFLVWLYLSWVVFLLGAEFAFVAHGYRDALRKSGIEPEEE